MTSLAMMPRCAMKAARSSSEIAMLMVNALPPEFVTQAHVLFVMEIKGTPVPTYAHQDTLVTPIVPISNIATPSALPLQIAPHMRHVIQLADSAKELPAPPLVPPNAQYLQLELHLYNNHTESVIAKHHLALLAPSTLNVLLITSALKELQMQLESSTKQEPVTVVNAALTMTALMSLKTAMKVFARLRLVSLTLSAAPTSATLEHAQLALFQEQVTMQRALALSVSSVVTRRMEFANHKQVLTVNMMVVAQQLITSAPMNSFVSFKPALSTQTARQTYVVAMSALFVNM